MNFGDFELKWLGHSGFLIKNSKVIYIDPYNIKEESEKADFILITHSHYDHCSYADLQKIVKEGTKILMTADCQSKVTRFETKIEMIVVEPNQEFSFGDFKIATVHAYNTDKSFHPKEEGWVGYLIKFKDNVVYHSGDSDFIPEMQKLTGHAQPGKNFIALLPIGGRFTMSVEEAFEAVKMIKPSIAIPMHWGSIIGSDEDAKEFAELCQEEGINSVILDKD